MRNNLIALTLTTALTVFTVSIADARTLSGVSEWAVNDIKVAQGPSYCTLAREYQENASVTFAKNIKGEGTIAFDFKRDVFRTAKAYTIVLRAGDVTREYTIKPASKSAMVMRTGTDASMFNAMQNTGALDIAIEDEQFTINLDGYRAALAELNACTGADVAQPVIVDRAMPRPPRANQVQEQSQLAAQDARVETLLKDNVGLVQTLNKEREDFRAQLGKANSKIPQERGAQSDPVLLQRLADAEGRNAQLLRKVSTLETQLQSHQNRVNPDVASALRASETRITLLQGEKQRLQSMLDEERSKRVAMETEIETLKARASSAALTSRNGALTNELKQQISTLQRQNTDLRQRLSAMESQEPRVVVKEIVKEVPVMPSNVPANVAVMAEQLAESETQALSMKAERDEYRKLLQRERQRLKDAGDIGQKINATDVGANNMVETVRRLEAEKVDLIRQLEFAKKASNGQKGELSAKSSDAKLENRLAEVMQESEQAKQQLRLLAEDKKALHIQLQRAEADIASARQSAASNTVSKLATSDVKMDAELKSLRSEIAALEAQNLILREDMAAKSSRQSISSDSSNKMIERLERKYQNRFQAMERENIRLTKALNEKSKPSQSVESAINAAPSLPMPNTLDRGALPRAPKVNAKSVMIDSNRISHDNAQSGGQLASATDARKALRNKLTGRPVGAKSGSVAAVSASSKVVAMPVAKTTTSLPVVSVPNKTVGTMSGNVNHMAALSGDEIKRLVMQSNIPLVSPIGRVAKVSGPDFTAFRWDTGVVYGSAEQTKLSNASVFEKSVSQYIAKTQSRCVGDFDKTMLPVAVSNGLNARAADIACVKNSDSGAVASILFFENNGMFYAVAHESNLNNFETAMQMRDQMANNLNELF